MFLVISAAAGLQTVTALHRSNQDIANQAVLEVSDRLLYDIENNRAPYQHGPLDPRLVGATDLPFFRK